MVSKDRRKFLQMSLLGAGSTAAMTLIPSSIRKAMALPANNATGSIMDVEHVVIYMQENRAFDHYYGTLNGVRGFGDPRAIRLPGGRPVWKRTESVRITPAYDKVRGRFVLTLFNSGDVSRTLHVAQSEVYRLDPGQQRTRSYELHPGESARDIWSLSASDHWYDLSVTMTGADRFFLRYAGHVETGKASRTDPAIGQMRL